MFAFDVHIRMQLFSHMCIRPESASATLAALYIDTAGSLPTLLSTVVTSYTTNINLHYVSR